MEDIHGLTLRIFTLLSILQVSDAYCYYSCWYYSWYFWFGLFWLVVFAIAGTVACIQYCNKNKRQVRPRGQPQTVTVVSGNVEPPKPPPYGAPSQAPPAYSATFSNNYSSFPPPPQTNPGYPPPGGSGPYPPPGGPAMYSPPQGNDPAYPGPAYPRP